MVNSASENNPLFDDRDCRYGPSPGLTTRFAGRGWRHRRRPKGRRTIMKKIAIVTVAVLALGLAACNKNNAENNAANETAVENNAANDTNVATENATTAADNALNAAGNDVNAAGNAVENASNAVANASTNK